MHAGSTGEMVALADQLLTAHVPANVDRTHRAQTQRAERIIRTIAVDPAITRVDQLSQVTGTNVRTLQRICGEYVGVSPKWAIRVYRINDAARRIEAAEQVDYAALAADLGYADQAHFIRDFTATVGTPPAQYRQSLS